MTRPYLVLFLIGFMVCRTAGALAFDETLEVHSRTIADIELLRDKANAGSPVTLSGKLSGPDAQEKLPVVICCMVGAGRERSSLELEPPSEWQRHRDIELRQLFSTRLQQHFVIRSQFGTFNQIFYTYCAVEALAANPKINGKRVVVMGFSFGGITALYSAMARFHQSFGPKEGQIIAYLPFYPYCNFGFTDELNVVDAPIREFHGARRQDARSTLPCLHR